MKSARKRNVKTDLVMVRGYHRVICPHYGHSFIALDIEDNATVFSMPVTCPKCKRIFAVWGLAGLISRLVRVHGTIGGADITRGGP